MARKSDFSSEQWQTLRTAPHLVVVAVASAGGSGLFGSIKEAIAPAGAIIEALKGDNELLKDLCQKEEMQAAVEAIKEEAKAGDFKTIQAHFRAAATERAQAAVAIIREKSPTDGEAYGDFLMKLAERVANAASEGGFLGFGGERVSEPEQILLAELAAAVGRPGGTLAA
jgi:hypothetical protein